MAARDGRSTAFLDTAVTAIEALVGGAPSAASPAPAPAPALPPAAAAAAAAAAPELQPYQEQVVSSFMRSTGNEVIFHPTGLGAAAVVDAVVARTLARHPAQHVVVCVVRPAQALAHAARMQASLGVSVAA
jgi:hypothetical protein